MEFHALKNRSQVLLSQFSDASKNEQDVAGSRPKQVELEAIVAHLKGVMDDPEGHANRQFNGLSEALCRCVVLYDERPDDYGRLIEKICTNENELFLDSFEGIKRLSLLCGGLADDHDFVFNEKTKSIEIGSVGQDSWGLTPSKLLRILKDMEPKTPRLSI